MGDSDVNQMDEIAGRETVKDDYLNMLEQRLEKEIDKTPTGKLRELLTELNIIFKLNIPPKPKVGRVVNVRARLNVKFYSKQNTGVRKFIDYQLGMTGDFYKLLFEALLRADGTNFEKLKQGFPEEAQAVWNFHHHPTWWVDMERRLGLYD